MPHNSDNKIQLDNGVTSHFLSLQSESGIGEIPLHSLSRRKPVIVDPESTLRDTLIVLNQGGRDAGLVAKNVDFPLGIVTLRNLLDAITIQGGSLDDPVISFMTAAPISLPGDASLHRAKVLMTRRRLSHLLLTKADGRFYSLISQSDIPGHCEGGANELIKKVNTAKDIHTIASAANEIRKRGAELFASGMGVEALCQWMSGLNDLISMQVVELVADTFDLPPIPWCWMVFGSEGRLEQTFSTDQDNGLIFQADKEENAQSMRQAFLPFTSAVNKALDQCGFDFCKGNIMAGNPAWCLSFREWQDTFSHWMKTPDPEALLNSTIFFDFRPLYGQDELVDELRSWLLPMPAQNPRFLYGLSEQALSCSPSLGFMGRFVYDGGKEFPHTIDLKMHGSRPFVDAARVWALKYQSWATNTADRLRSAATEMKRSVPATAAAVEAFDLIQRIRIHQQLSCKDLQRANRVDPKQLNDLQKLMIKEAFNQAKLLQLRLKQDFDL
ncbi:MAG: CBS domain-containing protein [Desulfobulbaceae bacterium]|uniref:CBS domain-containing protein n=1 Tax=Candidatus Desulfobia pelagia TaxID=2841692 RepID=A0A8J6TBV3_9BACT|nr:CBS domain-containing protein [Candidatus Desulfobia pelagia]